MHGLILFVNTEDVFAGSNFQFKLMHQDIYILYILTQRDVDFSSCYV